MTRAVHWSVYVVRRADGALYTGISTDVELRVAKHASGRGAKALRGRGPLELVYRVRIGDRGLAQRVEHALKSLAKTEKEALVRARPDRRRWMRKLGAA
jgi:putative endonuclease